MRCFKFQSGFREKITLVNRVFYRFIGLFFIFTAISKSGAFYRLEEVFSFIGLPIWSINPVAWGLIFLELILGICMMFLIAKKVVIYISITLLLIFSGFLIFLMFEPYAPPCGCMGNVMLFSIPYFENIFGLVRNLFFLLILLIEGELLFKKKIENMN